KSPAAQKLRCALQSAIGRASPHSRHLVMGNSSPQFGQIALVSNVSKRARHLWQIQNGPMMGGCLQEGQANPVRLGNFAIFAMILACKSPRQQLKVMNAAMTPREAEWKKSAARITTGTPIKPMIEATIKLRPLPMK